MPPHSDFLQLNGRTMPATCNGRAQIQRRDPAAEGVQFGKNVKTNIKREGEW